MTEQEFLKTKQHRIENVDDAIDSLCGLWDYFDDYEENGIRYSDVDVLITHVLDSTAFREAPGAASRHHAYAGGLLVHTAQVTFTMLDMLRSMENARLLEATVAAVWHDFGKIWDYEFACDEYTKTPHCYKINHVARSYSEFNKVALDLCPAIDVDFVGHLILSHHGRKEWGSPVEPQCVEAWALHAADMLSAQFIRNEVEYAYE